MSNCSSCRSRFDGSENDVDLALSLCEMFPEGECEQCSVGEGTIGPLADNETVIRIMVDPRDLDDGQITEAPFRTAFTNGLSVLRSSAPDQDCLDQTEEGMYRKTPDDLPRRVELVCVASVAELREHKNEMGGTEGRSFFVYDQTVSRMFTSGTPIAGHAGVFQRALKKGTQNKKLLERDLAGALKSIFAANAIKVADFRAGLLTSLNDRSDDGEFTMPPDTKAAAKE